ncbi:MAG: hypothetical protein EBT84_12080 [Sphingomonadaceae bacterium]|nr:hypothetical protein [Sphingomonadaceae bacterium]
MVPTFAPKRETKLRSLPRPTPMPEPMPPPEPPPKPLEEPPPIMPVLREATEEVGRSGREMVAVELLEVMRAAFLAIDLGFLGWARVLNCLALSPAAPPPWPVEKESGSFFTESVTVEMTQMAAMRIRTRWMISEMVRPSPPSFCQNVRFERVACTSSAAGAPASVIAAWSASSGWDGSCVGDIAHEGR